MFLFTWLALGWGVLDVYDFKKVEGEILEFWEKNSIYRKSKDRVKNGGKFYFLQGPPYTSGRIHLGTMWNTCFKDQVIRYKRMRGFNVWDRGGYDMHGLPTESKVQKNFNLADKKAIQEFGVERFVSECRKFCVEMANAMTEDFWKFGVWMDNKNAYMPIENKFIDGEWLWIKKAHDDGRLYLGNKVMTWCQECETSLAKHELEYENVKENSIFVKFKVKDKENEYLIIWTTTPWTIAYNLGVMVNPNLDYVRCRVGDETWVLAKDLAGVVLQSVAGRKLDVVDEFKGSELEGVHYVHPFFEELRDVYLEVIEGHPKSFSVVLSEEYVDLSAGTGLVHMAPGCGPEDYEVGKANDIPAFNNLDEKGFYPENMGCFAGLNAKGDNEKFSDALKEKGALIAVSEVEHDYPHCSRCKSPVIFRVTEQWFFRVEDLKQKLVKLNRGVKWVPKSQGERYEAWVSGLKDNGVTRQRFWGCPMPLWICDSCGKHIVVGSAAELKKYCKKIPDDLHKPWIDSVMWECGCGGKMKRVPDVLDVWLDSGTVSWNCLNYPSRDFEKFWPADFIVEASEQVRLWFYMLNLASVMMFDKDCYKNVYCTGMLYGVGGVKMSKSLGNIISPYEVSDKYGVDVMRLYISTKRAGEDLNFEWDDIELKFRNFGVLLNTCKYLLDYAPADIAKLRLDRGLELEDKYFLSRVNSVLKDCGYVMDEYRLDECPVLIEELFLELSRFYIQFTRERIREKAVFGVIYYSLFRILRVLAISSPFISDYLYLNLRERFGLKEESVHLCDWPLADEEMIDRELEGEFDVVRAVIQEIMAKRNDAGVGVRWPLASARIVLNVKLKNNFSQLIMKQCNLKSIEIEFKERDISDKVEGFRHGSVELDTRMSKELEGEGYAREVVRRVQAARRKAGLSVSDRIELVIKCDYDFDNFAKWMKERVGASRLDVVRLGVPSTYKYIAKDKIKGKVFEFFFNKS